MRTLLFLILTAGLSFSQQDENTRLFYRAGSIKQDIFPETRFSWSKINPKAKRLEEIAKKAKVDVAADPLKDLVFALIAAADYGIAPNVSELHSGDREILNAAIEKARSLSDSLPGTRTICDSTAVPEKPKSDGLVPNPIIFEDDGDPVRRLAEYTAHPRVTRDEAAKIVAERKREKAELAREEAADYRNSQVLDELRKLRVQAQSQQQDLQNLADQAESRRLRNLR
ncbi:MAG: hypothetical protein WCK57_00715 [Verrucomicrobiae bacterium]